MLSDWKSRQPTAHVPCLITQERLNVELRLVDTALGKPCSLPCLYLMDSVLCAGCTDTADSKLPRMIPVDIHQSETEDQVLPWRLDCLEHWLTSSYELIRLGVPQHFQALSWALCKTYGIVPTWQVAHFCIESIRCLIHFAQ